MAGASKQEREGRPVRGRAPAAAGDQLVLLCRAAGLGIAIPLAHVIETMRPLPVEPLGEAPEGVRGVALIRGTPVPVVDAGVLLGHPLDRESARFVTVRAGPRVVALAVSQVEGVRALDAATMAELPPLLAGGGDGPVAALGRLDADLLVVLRGAAIVPDRVWASFVPAGEPV